MDRGRRSVEVICLMFAFTLAFPSKFFVLRGNHEAEEINRFYGFHEEVVSRYDVDLWNDFNASQTFRASCFGYKFSLSGGIYVATIGGGDHGPNNMHARRHPSAGTDARLGGNAKSLHADTIAEGQPDRGRFVVVGPVRGRYG